MAKSPKSGGKYTGNLKGSFSLPKATGTKKSMGGSKKGKEKAC